MLSKNMRLRGQISNQFFHTAKRQVTPLGLCYFYKLPPTKTPTIPAFPAQIAFITPKKTFRSSVSRHAARRRAVTIVRHNYSQFPPGQYVFVLSRDILKSDHLSQFKPFASP